jgi:catechol 2,3-dioxygenase-like lactoylglutathione lyase family enzyme
MFKNASAFNGFSVDDLEKAASFYGETLGLETQNGPMGLHLKAGNNSIFVYLKKDHQPATFTILNFEVDDIEKAVDQLTEKGIRLESYPDLTDEKGIARGISQNRGPDIAWFKDPAGNILAVLQQS